MSRYKNIFLAILLSVMAWSCSDELETRGLLYENDFLNLTISVPEAQVVKTRDNASESEMELSDSREIHAYIFDGNDLIRHEKLTGISDGSTAKIPMDETLKNASTLKILVVANLEEGGLTGVTAESSYGDYFSAIDELSSNQEPSSPFYMSGVATGSGHTYTVNLDRSAAKVSMQLSGVNNFRLEGYTMYNAASNGYITAGAASQEEFADTYIFADSSIKYKYDITSSSEGVFSNYAYPVKTVQGGSYSSATDIGNAYFILKGKFDKDTESTYYRVDLKKPKEDTSYNGNYYNLEPNHWYQVEITEVFRRGYTSAAEAAKRSMEDEMAIKAEIHDHAASVLSMVTDGVRELGATYQVIWKESQENDPAQNTFCIKWYSPIAGEEAEPPTVRVISGNDWLVLGDSEEVPEGEDTSGNQTETNQKGEAFQYNPGLRVNYTMTTSVETALYDMEAVVRVEWMGMTRDVTITRYVDFVPQSICNVLMSIWGPWRADIQDYWSFLAEEGNSTKRGGDDQNAPVLYGVSREAMADGKIRNEGFHFSMPYGIEHNGKYEYTVTFNEDNFPNISDIFVEKLGDSYISDRLTAVTYNADTEREGDIPLVDQKNKVILLYDIDYGDTSRYTYATGSLKFWIKFKPEGSETDKTTEVTFDTYHTGFFHWDKDAYYYYEVVPMGNGYWLDRNLGAMSNRMYIDNGHGQISGGNSKAKGRFYTIAHPWKDYDQPYIYQSLSIPGYHLPNRAEWDAVRLSTNFTSSTVTDNNVSYISTYYQTPITKIGRVYFPKARYYNLANSYDVVYENNANMGDAGGGYYWTTTSSQGLEKEEIGQWLKVLNLSGMSNTYINGSINDSKMNVRLVAGRYLGEDEVHALNFNVRGATHVYLYSIDVYGQKSGVFSFPGKAIGSQTAVDKLYESEELDDNGNLIGPYLHFAYNSPISDTQLKVFFSYVTDEGKISILSKNKKDNLEDAEGWDVLVGWNYFFDWENGKPIGDPDYSPMEPENAGGAKQYIMPGKTIHITWPASINIDGEEVECQYIYVWDEKYVTTGGWPGKKGTKEGDTYHYDIVMDSLFGESDVLHVILHNKCDENGKAIDEGQQTNYKEIHLSDLEKVTGQEYDYRLIN